MPQVVSGSALTARVALGAASSYQSHRGLLRSYEAQVRRRTTDFKGVPPALYKRIAPHTTLLESSKRKRLSLAGRPHVHRARDSLPRACVRLVS